MFSRLWSDTRGGVITTELLLVSSVVVAGLLTGLNAFRSSVTAEFEDLGHTVREFDEVEQLETQMDESLNAVNGMSPEIYVPEGFINAR